MTKKTTAKTADAKPIVQMVYDTDRTEANAIETYYHCALCIEELCKKTVGRASPKEYARLQAGVTSKGDIQIWCNRHEVNVAIITPRIKK